MAASTPTEQLDKYLADAHSIEEQAIAQLRLAPRLAGDPQLAEMYRAHLEETRGHERRVRERLDAHGQVPSRIKDAMMAAGGVGFGLFALLQPGTPGKLAAHSHSYEALELASYELLERVARRAGDEQTAADAHAIAQEEAAMIRRIAEGFERSVEATLKGVKPDDMGGRLVSFLGDAHAIEGQAIELLERGPQLAGDPEIAHAYEQHLHETRRHESLIRARLEAHGARPSVMKDAALRLGGLNWGGFFMAHPDTPGKLAAFAFAFEHLEIGAYEQLWRVAERAGDSETAAVAKSILEEERHAATTLASSFDRAAQASLQAVGVV